MQIGLSGIKPLLSRLSFTGSVETTMVYISVCLFPSTQFVLSHSTAVDPKIGQAGGFGGVILHGLASYGFAARAVVSAVGGNDPNSLKFFGARFTSPVKPGDALETSIWEVGSGPSGTTEVAFVVKDLNTNKVREGPRD